MKGFIELVVAYAVVWIGLFGYMVYLNMRQRRLIKEIELLKGMKDEHGRKD
jgi:CcmD family protein